MALQRKFHSKSSKLILRPFRAQSFDYLTAESRSNDSFTCPSCSQHYLNPFGEERNMAGKTQICN
jgi:hypothetical protein